ncbi:DUF4013 domain-containing protein [Haloplanus halophilus]|uniref:DUF4013 domain-containing protein n=1 Tax=Haloplanus halophilus TaxID=2949993 RepID=UPI0020424EDA|nr:DUF4013 domain-containing protein [Haloplanus sp. GDY1]
MAVDLERLVRYPATGDDWAKTLLVGGLLTALSVLIVPAFLLYGYLLRVLRDGMAEGREPPVFDDWWTLLRDGVVAVLIVLVYQFVPLLVAALTVGGSVLALLTGSEVGVGVGLFGLLAGLALSAALALVFGYVTPIGVANYTREGTAGAAFDTGVLRDVALDGAYAVAWLYGVALLLAASVVAGLLGFVPVVGVFVGFYAQVAAAWVWGKGFADAMGLDGAVESASPSTA